MLLKSYNLTGKALDWAVAKARNEAPEYNRNSHGGVWPGWTISTEYSYCALPPYCKDGEEANYLQEELKISVMYVKDDDSFAIEDGPWTAAIPNSEYGCTGSTALIAICRCYVTAKLGEDIEIPAALLKD